MLRWGFEDLEGPDEYMKGRFVMVKVMMSIVSIFLSFAPLGAPRLPRHLNQPTIFHIFAYHGLRREG